MRKNQQRRQREEKQGCGIPEVKGGMCFKGRAINCTALGHVREN